MKTIKVLVLADFAKLKREQIAKIVDTLQKKFPENVILPREDEDEKRFNQQSKKVEYRYYLCTIERSIKGGVTVLYYATKTKRNMVIADVSL
jgi:hypothetical protein